jgi:hypothetical protein
MKVAGKKNRLTSLHNTQSIAGVISATLQSCGKGAVAFMDIRLDEFLHMRRMGWMDVYVSVHASIWIYDEKEGRKPKC